MPPKPPPTNFNVLRHYAHISHSAAHAHPTDITRAELLAQQSAHDAQLTSAITEVRRKIMDEEMRLSSLQSQQIPAPTDPPLTIPTDPEQKLRKLKALKAAHVQGFQTIDYIPPADSPLNTLLAYRSVETVITKTNASIQVVEEKVKSAHALLKTEDGILVEQTSLMEALRSRLETMEEEERRIDVGDIQGQGDMVKKMARRRKDLMKRTKGMLRELLYFLDAGLARMVAAEEMGGPVVGDELDVTLETGFDKKGKVKKGNRRIDEMWGQGVEDPEKKMKEEFKNLIEELMNASLENLAYVELKKDSAAARFLVRAKVAVFHPKDARRLKLVDFGSNVEDG